MSALLIPALHHYVRRTAVTTIASPLQWNPAIAVSDVQRKALRERLSASTVFIRAGRGFGSGFVATTEGRIVTNHHVISAAPDAIQILTEDGAIHAHVIASFPQYDIAVLQPTLALAAPALPISDALSGDPRSVFALGAPHQRRNTFLQGMITGIQSEQWQGGRQWMPTTDIPLEPGNSGGPVVDGTGTVVGMATGAYGRGAVHLTVSGAAILRVLGWIDTRLAELEGRLSGSHLPW